MMKVAILVLALCAIAFAATPLRPVISETYEGKINIEFTNKTHHVFGTGDEARDFKDGKEVFRAEFDTNPRFLIYELTRFDLGKAYVLDSFNFTNCITRNITGTLPPTWGWLVNATYVGQFSFRGQTFDWWNNSAVIGGITFHFAAAFVDAGAAAPTVPSFAETFWEYNGNFERRTIGYENFIPNITNPAFFDVPKVCTSPMSIF